MFRFQTFPSDQHHRLCSLELHTEPKDEALVLKIILVCLPNRIVSGTHSDIQSQSVTYLTQNTSSSTSSPSQAPRNNFPSFLYTTDSHSASIWRAITPSEKGCLSHRRVPSRSPTCGKTVGSTMNR